MTDYDNRTVRIDDEEIEYSISTEFASPVDPERLAYFGALLAEAVCQFDKVRAEYRAWKSKQLSLVVDTRRAKPIPEWKAKARVESDPECHQYRLAIANAKRHVTLLTIMVRALDLHLCQVTTTTTDPLTLPDSDT